jgi:hypothetical protein
MAGFRTRFPAVTPRGRSCYRCARWFRRCFGPPLIRGLVRPNSSERPLATAAVRPGPDGAPGANGRAGRKSPLRGTGDPSQPAGSRGDDRTMRQSGPLRGLQAAPTAMSRSCNGDIQGLRCRPGPSYAQRNRSVSAYQSRGTPATLGKRSLLGRCGKRLPDIHTLPRQAPANPAVVDTKECAVERGDAWRRAGRHPARPG